MNKDFTIMLLVWVAVLFLAAGCADNVPVATPGNCSVIQTSSGATINCPGGTTATVSNGSQGSPGATGATGAQGLQGNAGDSTTVTAIIAPASACTNGGYILNFTDSTTGRQTQAPVAVCNGLNGAPGQDATSVSTVQFCASAGAPSYPSTFPEYGIVIGTTVYGVYSANGGFLALLPPGEYSSDGINASCDFSINANGTVTEN